MNRTRCFPTLLFTPKDPSRSHLHPAPHRIRKKRNTFGTDLENEGKGEEVGKDKAGNEEIMSHGKHAHLDLRDLPDEALDSVDP